MELWLLLRQKPLQCGSFVLVGGENVLFFLYELVNMLGVYLEDWVGQINLSLVVCFSPLVYPI